MSISISCSVAGVLYDAIKILLHSALPHPLSQYLTPNNRYPIPPPAWPSSQDILTHSPNMVGWLPTGDPKVLNR